MHSSDIFNAAPAPEAAGDGAQLFTIGGSPSFRIHRRCEPRTSVFPSGCMGNESAASRAPAADAPAQPEATPSEPEQGEEAADADEQPEAIGDGHDAEDRPEMYQYAGSNIARNPLTGHGMNEAVRKQGKQAKPRTVSRRPW